ncbi:DUF551 domain-containing protein [Salmonella enterica subsp. enterica serovar Newport]|uniref:DUF551 domain-containing protein n=1 Tax=Salmonella enterica TaxID=28901 RepID=UPI001F4F9DBD|nr:DUF551 domain-containing protein [Salmonella enterica]
MTTITKEEIKAFIEQIESDLANGWEAQIFELKLARIALASLEAEPVAYIFKHPAGELFWSLTDESNKGQNDVMPVYAAQPVPVGNEFIPKNLDKALGVVGVALPESKEEFNFQIERWIQRLIDRVIRYADEFKEQPVPVTQDGWIRCSERMPDKLIPVMVMYADGEMWSAIWTGTKWDDGTEFPDPHAVTHWQEMPAAPQQEVVGIDLASGKDVSVEVVVENGKVISHG